MGKPSAGSRLQQLGGTLRRTVIGGAGLAILLVAPVVHADPSASCCFTGTTSTCLDGYGRNLVCDLIDPFCCNNSWDDLCVQEYQDWVGYTCPPLFHGSYSYGGPGGDGDGDGDSSHDAAISEFGEDACGNVDPQEYQWTAFFDLPANPFAGSTAITGVDTFVDGYRYSDWFFLDSASVEIFSNTNGVLHGVLETDWFGDLGSVCDEPSEGVRFRLDPRTNKSCWSSSNAPRCNERVVEAYVCHNDPFCCNTAWDQLCVYQAYTAPSHVFSG